MIGGSSGPVLRGASSLPPIVARYLLVINVPLYRNGRSGLCADRLWFKDLSEHLAYLDDLAVACPLADGVPADGAVPLTSDPRFARVSIICCSRPAAC
jgi:hypothetical protein